MLLDYETAIIATAQGAIGAGFFWLAQYLSSHISWKAGRVILAWPCYGLGFLFLLGAALTILWNMVGPIVLWLLSFIIPN